MTRLERISPIAFAMSLCSCAHFPTRNTHAETPLTLAVYYPWYRDGRHPQWPWSHWTREEAKSHPDALKMQRPGEPPLSSGAYPLAGLYDSGDVDVAKWHVRLAHEAGIEGFLVSWWDDVKGIDKAFEQGILAAAEDLGFKVALFDERAQFHNDFDWYKGSLTRALGRYKDSPAYLYLDGRPVVYLYQVTANATLTPQKFKELRCHVETVHGPVYWVVDKLIHDAKAYNAGDTDKMKRIPEDWLSTPGIDAFSFYSTFSHFRSHEYEDLVGKYTYLTDLAHKADKGMILPVHPGHNNARFSDNPYIMPRRDGQTLRDYLNAATDAGADIVMITSWNEWPETTVVEPSSSWEDPYLYLKIIADWKGVSFKEIPTPSLR